MESRDVGFQVFGICESDSGCHEIGWYHDIHDRLGELHGASPNWNRRALLPYCAFPQTL